MIDTYQPLRETVPTLRPPDAAVPAPQSIRWAYWMVIVGTLAAVGSNVLELRNALAGTASIAATGDLVLTILFIAMFGFFAEMIRKGRRWGRVLLTIFAGLGLLFNTLGLLHIAGRPIDGLAQTVLAHVGNVASVAGIVCLYLPSANTFFRTVGEQARTISNSFRKVMLTVHIAVSVGWLGLVDAMLAMALTGTVTDDVALRDACFTTMSLMDAIFLGLTSLFAWITGIVGAAGTKWHLMRRHWVAIKFVATTTLMMFGFGAIHPGIAKVNALIRQGAPAGQVHRAGVQLVSFILFAALTLITMVILSTYKPWGLTRYGRRRQATERRPEAAVRRAAP